MLKDSIVVLCCTVRGRRGHAYRFNAYVQCELKASVGTINPERAVLSVVHLNPRPSSLHMELGALVSWSPRHGRVDINNMFHVSCFIHTPDWYRISPGCETQATPLRTVLIPSRATSSSIRVHRRSADAAARFLRWVRQL